MKRNKILAFVTLFMVTIGFQFWVGCSAYYQPGRNYLVSGEYEQEGFGLYSYILFTENPDKNDSLKYAALLSAYLNKIPEVNQLLKYVSSDSINNVYLPVMEDPYYINGLNDSEQIDTLIEIYDYARAQAYLNKFEEDLTYGPYIISYNIPLSQAGNIKSKYLLQDLSSVHPEVVTLWVDEFLKQSSQEAYWDEEYLRNFSNDLRNAIAIAADGLKSTVESLKWWEENLPAWITFN
ncbi:MAG: hypothetical protein ABFS35_23420 [Bacteroidota bacterium]